MSTLVLDYPLESLPGLPAQEGLRFNGVVRAGRAQVSVSDAGETLQNQAENDADAVRQKAAEHFFTAWSGKGTLLSQEEIDKDPRLAYLTAKHIH